MTSNLATCYYPSDADMLVDFKTEIGLIQEKIHSAQNILILTKSQPSYDGLASALSLYLTLVKSGKKVTLACSSDLTVSYSDLVGVDKVKKEMSGKNFVISLDYQEGAIEKVSYNIENNKFNLVIQPREGSNWDLSPDKIQFNYQPTDFNLIITLELSSIDELNTLFPNEQELFSKVPIVAINKALNTNQFATINLSVPTASSLSEIVAQLLTELNLVLDPDVAGNLVKGIYNATSNLQAENISADTFEALALCLRSGAKITGSKNGSAIKIDPETLSSLSQPKPVTPVSNDKPPEDWLKPKIFKGSTLL